MTETTAAATDEQPHPFDPALPGEVRAYLDAWKADGGASYVSQGFFHDGTSRRLTVAQLEQLLEQLAWHKQAGADLADACARLRQERDDARQQSAARLALLDDAATDGLAAIEQRDVLYETLRQVLGTSWECGHPGYAAMRTFWIYADTVKKWKAVLGAIPRPDARRDARPDDAASVLGGCPRCRRRVPLEHVTVTASHCVEGTAIECTGTGLAPVDLSAPQPSAGPERRTPEAWCTVYGVEIRDPDGWRTPGAPAWDIPITLADFRRRLAASTARPTSPRTLAQIHLRISSDLYAERGKD